MLSVSQSVLIVVEQLIALDNKNDSDNDGIVDSVEGYGDSDGDAIVDYLDNDSNTSHLPSGEFAEPMQTSPGLMLSLGSLIRALQGADSQYASLNIDDLAQIVGEGAADTQDHHFLAVSPLYNFVISTF